VALRKASSQDVIQSCYAGGYPGSSIACGMCAAFIGPNLLQLYIQGRDCLLRRKYIGIEVLVRPPRGGVERGGGIPCRSDVYFCSMPVFWVLCETEPNSRTGTAFGRSLGLDWPAFGTGGGFLRRLGYFGPSVLNFIRFWAIGAGFGSEIGVFFVVFDFGNGFVFQFFVDSVDHCDFGRRRLVWC